MAELGSGECSCSALTPLRNSAASFPTHHAGPSWGLLDPGQGRATNLSRLDSWVSAGRRHPATRPGPRGETPQVEIPLGPQARHRPHVFLGLSWDMVGRRAPCVTAPCPQRAGRPWTRGQRPLLQAGPQ